MASNSTTPKNKSNSSFITMQDDIQCPSVIKEFYSDLCINMEKKRWSSKCKNCRLIITDSYKTTSNFLKHLKNKHQHIFDQWKNDQDQSIIPENQPKINNIFSPDGEKCEFFSV